MRRLSVTLFILVTVVLMVTSPVQGQMREDHAGITFAGPVPVTAWSSSPYDQWVYYQNTNWWNTWFYDHPLDYRKWKEFSLDMTVLSQSSMPIFLEVAINYSTDVYSLTGPTVGPPLPPLDPLAEEAWVGRYVVFAGDVLPGPVTEPYHFKGRLPVPYNPEYVSIDVRPPTGGTIMEVVELNFILWHNCVPEPATLGLVALGVAAMFCRRVR